MTRRPKRALALLGAALVLVANLGLGACDAAGAAGSVSVLASWTGDEQAAFQRVLDRFTADTKIKVSYFGTRALSQVLASDVQKGTPPNIAVLPNAGELAKYLRSGSLHPLDDVLTPQDTSAYSAQWQQLQRLGRDRPYAVAVKADLKSIIWYDPARMSRPDMPTWAHLVAFRGPAAATWCMGIGAPPNTGFPGTDWIEDILLHQSGEDVYRQWATGKLAWTSPQVRAAWAAWGAVLVGRGAVLGGATSALLTDFADAGRPMFTTPQECSLEHQASFIMGTYRGYRRPGPQPGIDFDFIPFPAFDGTGVGRAAEVSADLAGLFEPTPQARTLIKYLASEQAQRIWPGIPGASAFSANRTVNLAVYGDKVSQRIAQTLNSDTTLCFDASDLMPATMTNAFYRAVLEYLTDPSKLDTVLGKLDKVRTGIAPEEWLDFSCGQ